MQIQLTSAFELKSYPSTTDLSQMVLHDLHFCQYLPVFKVHLLQLSPVLQMEEGIPIPDTFPGKTQLHALPWAPSPNTCYPKAMSSTEDQKPREVN